MAYDEGGLLAQPRIIAKTKNIERAVVLVRDPQSNELLQELSRAII